MSRPIARSDVRVLLSLAAAALVVASWGLGTFEPVRDDFSGTDANSPASFPVEGVWEELPADVLPRHPLRAEFVAEVKSRLDDALAQPSEWNRWGGDLEESVEVLGLLPGCVWPDVAGLERVVVREPPRKTPAWREAKEPRTLCWLVDENETTFTVLEDDQSLTTYPRSGDTTYEPIDYEREVDEYLAVLAPGELTIELTVTGDVDVPFTDGEFLLQHACFAFDRGLDERCRALMRHAIDVKSTMLAFSYEQASWQLFERGLSALHEAGDRRLARGLWRGVLTRYPGSSYEDQCRAYVRTLERMIAEDERYQAPADLASLPVEERVVHLVHDLREVDAAQWAQPGHCHLLGAFSGAAKPRATDRLAAIGKPAVPALIALLEDDRLTRSYGFWRDFSPWRWVLQYRDAAIQTLEHVANESFYVPQTSSSYFSNESDETRAEIIGRVRAWWRAHEDRSEAEWLRESLDGELGWFARDIHAAERLVELEGAAVAGFLREKLEAEPENGWPLKLLVKAAGRDALPDVMRVTKSSNLRMRVSAYRHLLELEDPRAVPMMIAELEALATEPPPAGVKLDRGDYLFELLLQSGTAEGRDAVCRALHEGNFWASDRARNALGGIDEPWVVPHLGRALFDERRRSEKGLRICDWAASGLIHRFNLPIRPPYLDEFNLYRDDSVAKVREWWRRERAAYGESRD